MPHLPRLHRLAFGLPALGLGLLLSACASGGGGPATATASVSGTASYRERMALPPQAVFEAVLEDVSLADAPARELGRFKLDAPQVPVRFQIAYDPARIERHHRYAVRASIRLDGRLLFTTDTLHQVLGDTGVNQVELMLVRVSPAPEQGAAATSVTR